VLHLITTQALTVPSFLGLIHVEAIHFDLIHTLALRFADFMHVLVARFF